jgi:hypothetical protein
VSAQTNAQRLVVVPEPEDLSSSRGRLPQPSADHASCSFCFGTGMEVVAGKGARRCNVVHVTRKQNSSRRRASRVATASARYRTYHPASNNGSQLRAFNLAYRLVREYPAVERGLLLMGRAGWGRRTSRRRLFAGSSSGACPACSTNSGRS